MTFNLIHPVYDNMYIYIYITDYLYYKWTSPLSYMQYRIWKHTYKGFPHPTPPHAGICRRAGGGTWDGLWRGPLIRTQYRTVPEITYFTRKTTYSNRKIEIIDPNKCIFMSVFNKPFYTLNIQYYIMNKSFYTVSTQY